MRGGKELQGNGILDRDVLGSVSPRSCICRGLCTVGVCQRRATPVEFLDLCGFGQRQPVFAFRELEEMKCGMAGELGEAEQLPKQNSET